MLSIGNIFKTNPAEFDEVWVLCFAVDELRSLFEDFDNVLHVPELAPKESLFKEYRSMVHSGQWNEQAFEESYVPRFLKDIQTSETAMKQLRALVAVSGDKNIRLACFYSDDEEGICHRSIVAGLLLNMGACVECNEAYRAEFAKIGAQTEIA